MTVIWLFLLCYEQNLLLKFITTKQFHKFIKIKMYLFTFLIATATSSTWMMCWPAWPPSTPKLGERWDPDSLVCSLLTSQPPSVNSQLALLTKTTPQLVQHSVPCSHLLSMLLSEEAKSMWTATLKLFHVKNINSDNYKLNAIEWLSHLDDWLSTY